MNYSQLALHLARQTERLQLPHELQRSYLGLDTFKQHPGAIDITVPRILVYSQGRGHDKIITIIIVITLFDIVT